MSADFVCGFTIATVFFGGLSILKEHLYEKLLIMKAEKSYRTAIKIKDNFYYIVPESEYTGASHE